MGSDEEGVSLARNIHAHPSLQELGVSHTPLDTPAALDSIVDAVIACGLTGLHVSYCSLGPEAVTHFARLLRDAPHLSVLYIRDDIEGMSQMCDADSAPILAAALRVSSLSVLCLAFIGVWDDGVGNVLVDALVGHPTLQEISLAFNSMDKNDPRNTGGACLARLVAANSPMLDVLDLFYLGGAGLFYCDDVLRPFFTMLPSNTFLHTLSLPMCNISESFARNVVLPSVRANASLRTHVMVQHGFHGFAYSSLIDAEALVEARIVSC